MIKIAKFCIICQKPLIGKARKYCKDCKRKEHLEQLHKYYIDHTSRWMYGGKYWNNRNPNTMLGSGSLGEHAITDDFDLEEKQIQKELKLLGLRQKNDYWQA